MAAATAERLRALPKGDALAVARIAGIQAAKRTSDLIPALPPAAAHGRRGDARGRQRRRRDRGRVETTAQTGVEMEALTAVAVAGLTVYDMAKAIDKEMRIDEVVLVSKTKEPA